MVEVTVRSEMPDRPLRDAFFALSKQLGPAVIAAGASPTDIKTLTIAAPDPAAIREDLPQLDLLYRECLGGNMGRVGLVRGPVLTFTVHAVVGPKPSAPVFRDYDLAALNFQYSPRMSVPEAAQHMASWREQGTAYQATHATEIVHSDREKHASDLYRPETRNGAPPLHVFIHGGYWQALDKRDNGFLFDGLVQAGIAVAALNYPLAPPASIGEILELCRASIADLYRKSGKYGYDPARLTVSGHSAGGHLTAALAATDWSQYGSDLPSDLIKGAAPMSGVFDLEPIRHTGLNNALNLSESETVSWSPTGFSIPSTIPFLISVGGAESDEFRRQSKDFQATIEAKGTTAAYLEVPGANHFTILHALSDSDSVLQKAMIRLARDHAV